jgi:hypothetical protein
MCCFDRFVDLYLIYFVDLVVWILVVVDKCGVVGEKKQSGAVFVQSSDVSVGFDPVWRKNTVYSAVIWIVFGDYDAFGLMK